VAATVISSVGFKGGTGKTSLVKNLGITLANKGKRVLLIDLCQNSDIATRLGYDRNDFDYDSYSYFTGQVPFKNVLQYDNETDCHFVPASKRVRKIVEYAEMKRPKDAAFIIKDKLDEEVIDRFDYIILDNHPDEEDALNLYSLVASSVVLVPTLMDISSVVATARTIQYIQVLNKQGMNLRYYVVPMAVDFAKGFKKELGQITKEFNQMGVEVTDPIRFSSSVPRQGLLNKVLDLKNQYVKNVMDDYIKVANQIIKDVAVINS
jgi:chromosome partitioning protein